MKKPFWIHIDFVHYEPPFSYPGPRSPAEILSAVQADGDDCGLEAATSGQTNGVVYVCS